MPERFCVTTAFDRLRPKPRIFLLEVQLGAPQAKVIAVMRASVPPLKSPCDSLWLVAAMIEPRLSVCLSICMSASLSFSLSLSLSLSFSHLSPFRICQNLCVRVGLCIYLFLSITRNLFLALSDLSLSLSLSLCVCVYVRVCVCVCYSL